MNHWPRYQISPPLFSQEHTFEWSWLCVSTSHRHPWKKKWGRFIVMKEISKIKMVICCVFKEKYSYIKNKIDSWSLVGCFSGWLRTCRDSSEGTIMGKTGLNYDLCVICQHSFKSIFTETLNCLIRWTDIIQTLMLIQKAHKTWQVW